MIQRALASRSFVASLLAWATGLALYFNVAFPSNDPMLQLIADSGTTNL